MSRGRGWHQPGWTRVGKTATTTVNVNAPLTGDGSSGSPLTIAAATDVVDGYLTHGDHASYTAALAKLAAIPWDLDTAIRMQAAAALGVSGASLTVYLQPFTIRGESGITASGGSGGTRSYQAQLYRLDSGGGAHGFWQFYLASSTPGIMQTVLAGATVKFWLAARMALPTGVGAGAQMGFGLGSAVQTELLFGGYGAVSTGNFAAFGAAGVSIDSGLALDNNLRTHVCWRDGTTTFYQIDANPAVSGSARPANSAAGYGIAFDTAAVDRKVDMAWCALAVVNP